MHIYNYHLFSSAGNSARPLKSCLQLSSKTTYVQLTWYNTNLVGKGWIRKYPSLLVNLH